MARSVVYVSTTAGHWLAPRTHAPRHLLLPPKTTVMDICSLVRVKLYRVTVLELLGLV